MSENKELFKMAPKDVTKVETFCEKHGFVYHNKGRGRNGFYAYWTFYKVVNNDKTLFSIEYTPVTHCSRNTISINGLCGSFNGVVKSVDHLKKILDVVDIDINDIENKERNKVTALYRFERKLKLANEIGKILDDVKGWRQGKGYEIVLQYDYLEIESLYELTRTSAQKIADQVLADYDSGKIN